ncbi:hypothetical protein CgunFtcFv8_007083 [Champsocephalus gunnari]|uniref:Uncharacterized protein n=1 Tax=Champsocephalus gunnari TaxID=52237 RepID=A0AAN8CGP7_CHAGU|nr:hypothetical protein CgunFtcFv8_007083 [Champsocephalus gunnari]
MCLISAVNGCSLLNTFPVSFLRLLAPCNCLASVLLLADNHRPVSHTSPQLLLPLNVLTLPTPVGKEEKRVVGKGASREAERDTTPAKASVRQPEGRPLFP